MRSIHGYDHVDMKIKNAALARMNQMKLNTIQGPFHTRKWLNSFS